MARIDIPNDVNIQGNLTSNTQTLPAACVRDTNVASNAAIDGTKLIGPRTITRELNGPTTTVTSQTTWIATIKGATGTLWDINAFIAVAAAGAATVTVDLKKSTGGGAFASVLSAVISIDNTTVIRTAAPGTITAASVVAGDILELVVVATAGGGTIPQGLTVTLRYEETYN